ncbi:hypothetical protein [Coleofasciculus sp. FACHB-SPT36]|uniref:hypothetical protein n=1 Tax=Cyanophyceae TaxID=3028117 RepID=UPI00168BF1D5|nr:hypothetical protein [Coleofasciculus sp. FACHB-SPT36]MBD2541719.1 hypothetical protein [Coleofasciculus sp. FACHB-SPT36]
MKNKSMLLGLVGLVAGSAIATGAVTHTMKMKDGTMQATSTNTRNDSHKGHHTAGTDPHEGHHMGHGSKHESAHESMPETEAAQAKLTIQGTITPNKPVSLAIDIQDKSGKAIVKFDTFQEKLMHLIVVSDDLQFFSHLHPTYKQNGRFEVEASFPQPGNYTLLNDYKPAGQKEQVSAVKTQIPGKILSASAIDLNRFKTFGNTKANLVFSESTLKAGKDVTLTFDLRDASNIQPVKDLQPYLGEKGHLVILRQSPSLTAADYIHAHAMKDTPEGQVLFHTKFPEPGKYKLWGQFNRNGKIVTADFWVEVL